MRKPLPCSSNWVFCATWQSTSKTPQQHSPKACTIIFLGGIRVQLWQHTAMTLNYKYWLRNAPGCWCHGTLTLRISRAGSFSCLPWRVSCPPAEWRSCRAPGSSHTTHLHLVTPVNIYTMVWQSGQSVTLHVSTFLVCGNNSPAD